MLLRRELVIASGDLTHRNRREQHEQDEQDAIDHHLDEEGTCRLDLDGASQERIERRERLVDQPQPRPGHQQARERGHVTVNGLGMLMNQARPAFHAWFGVMPEITPELRQAMLVTL